MNKRLIVSGFGGQGVLSLGIIISELALDKDLHVSWIPSYGAEMRGGTANCSVVYSNNLIGSPIVNDDADILIAMNDPSLIKFENKVKKGGLIIINSSVVTETIKRDDVKVLKVNATDIANDLGSSKVANMVVLGKYIEATNDFSKEDAITVINRKFKTKGKLIPMNVEALTIK